MGIAIGFAVITLAGAGAIGHALYRSADIRPTLFPQQVTMAQYCREHPGKPAATWECIDALRAQYGARTP